MKTKVLSLAVLLVLGTSSIFAANKSEKFKVNGKCGMCEKTIEKAANSVDGVSKADWNKETKEMEVVFDDTKTNIHKIHSSIAASGYDTDMHKATDKTYDALHGCCKYDRSSLTAKASHSSHMKSDKKADHSSCSKSDKKEKKSSCTRSKEAEKKSSCCAK